MIKSKYTIFNSLIEGRSKMEENLK